MANHDSPIPTTIGRYQVQALIGRGGMGEVYKAFDPRLDRVVALKTIRASTDADGPVLLERLFREAKACGRLHHPGIVTVHDLGDVDDVVFIAMEYLEGEDLQSASERGRFSFEQKIRVLIQILDALQYAHGEGVIHRDIKPSNVHVLPDGTVKLLDFGLARVTRAESLTLTGAIMGTPFYMSPEQLKGQNVDARTDIYSTGALAYELLTSRRAFEAETLTAVMLKVLSEGPPPMGTAWSAAFPEIERIVLRSVAKNPEDRYETAKDMRDALEAFLAVSEPAMAKVAAAAEASTQSALSAARTLLMSGRVEESHVVLARTLRENPDAIEVRALLAEATRVSAPPAAPPPSQASKPAPASARPAAAPPLSAAAPSQASKPAPASARPAVAPPPVPEQVVVAAPARSTRGRDLMTLGGFAAVIAIAAVWWTFGRGGGQSTTPPPVTTATTTQSTPPAPTPTPATPTPETQVAQVPEPQAQLPSTPPAGRSTPPPAATSTPAPSPPPSAPPAAPSTPPVASAPPAATQAPAPNPGPTQGTAPPSRQTSVPRGSTGTAPAATPPPLAANATGVFIEPGLDAALRTELIAALRNRDVPIQNSVQNARYRVHGELDMSVRTQTFGTTTTMTAEFVATLETLDQRTNTPDAQRLEGRALGFSDTAARAAGLKAAAEQMADAIRGLLRQ